MILGKCEGENVSLPVGRRLNRPMIYAHITPSRLKLAHGLPFNKPGHKPSRHCPFYRMPEHFQNPTDLATSLPVN